MQNKTNRGLSLTPRHATPRHATPRHASFDHHLIPRPVNSVNSLRNEPWEHNLWASEILKRRHFKTHQVTIAPIVLQCLFIYLTLCANSGQGADRPSTDTGLQKCMSGLVLCCTCYNNYRITPIYCTITSQLSD